MQLAPGLEEGRLAEALRAKGLEVVPKVRVQRSIDGQDDHHHHYYDIDLGIWPMAIELHTAPQSPVNQMGFYERITWLMRHGWAVACLWLHATPEFTDGAVDALYGYFQELKEAHPERFRLYLGDGELDLRGDLVVSYSLQIDWKPAGTGHHPAQG